MLSAEPKSEADNTYLDLDYLGYHKTKSNNCFMIHYFEENQDKPSQGTGIDIVIGNHALRGQPTE